MLKQMVECVICTNKVAKSEARLLDPFKTREEYECFDCFKNNGSKSSSATKPEQKMELFCTFCKFKFKSKKLSCPYCGKKEYLMENRFTTVDLLA